jgi:predicted nucleotidyltransferase
MRQRSIKSTLGSSKVMTILSKNLDRIKSYGVRRIGLFGSVLRGEAGPKSDIDILVEFDEGQATFDHLMGLHDYLTGILKRKVDLVTMGGLSPFIGPHILKEVRYVEGAS